MLRSARSAIAAPNWLVKRLKKDWFDRYGRRVENYRLPKLDSERAVLGNQMGEDGFNLLKKVYAPNAPEWLCLIPAVEILRPDFSRVLGSRVTFENHDSKREISLY